MAKTTGPLFSLEASGTVGKTVTYSHWKGRPYVRRRVIPLNPFEPDQVAARNRIRADLSQTAGGRSQAFCDGHALGDASQCRIHSTGAHAADVHAPIAAWNSAAGNGAVRLGGLCYAGKLSRWQT